MKLFYSVFITALVLGLGYSFSKDKRAVQTQDLGMDSISIELRRVNDSIQDVNTREVCNVVKKVQVLDSVKTVVENKLEKTELKLEKTENKLQSVKEELKQANNQPPVVIVKHDTITVRVKDRLFGKDKIDTLR